MSYKIMEGKLERKEAPPSETFLFILLVFTIISFVLLIIIYFILSYIPLRKTSAVVFETVEDVELTIDSICGILIANPNILGMRLVPDATLNRCKKILSAKRR